MVELRNVCEDILKDVEGSLGCAAIDLQTGSTLAAACRPEAVLDAGGMDLISVAVSEMFHGKLIRQFHRVWSGGAAAPERFVREVQMATANGYQFMSVVPDWEDCLLVLITDRSVSLGLGWMAVHQGLSRVSELPRPDSSAPSRPAPARTPQRVAAPTASAVAAAEARPGPPRSAPLPGEDGTGTRTRPRVATPPAPAAPTLPPPADTPPAAAAGRRQAPRQRTYRGVPVGAAEPPSEDERDVPMGPRGRMFTPRR